MPHVRTECERCDMLATKENRETRFSIRATARQKEMISRAAARRRQSISEFVLENSLEAAKALEMDNANFVLRADDYDAFLAALDEPPRSIPALRKLLAEPHTVDVPNT